MSAQMRQCNRPAKHQAIGLVHTVYGRYPAKRATVRRLHERTNLEVRVSSILLRADSISPHDAKQAARDGCCGKGGPVRSCLMLRAGQQRHLRALRHLLKPCDGQCSHSCSAQQPSLHMRHLLDLHKWAGRTPKRQNSQHLHQQATRCGHSAGQC